MASFSRRYRVQEKRSTRRGLFYIVAAIILFVLFLNYGIPAAGQLAGVIGSAKKDSSENQPTGKVTPISPQLDSLPQFTSQNSVTLTGRALPGSNLKIYRNNTSVKESVIDQSGNFSLSINLSEGENQIWATSTDPSNNESEKSHQYLIVFDNQPPALDITKPTDADTLYGSSNKTISVEGKSEKDARVTVNDRLAIVGDDGSFSAKISLNEGSNDINVVSTDQADNKTEKKITVTYSP